MLPKNFNKDTAVILAQAVNSSQAIFYICFILIFLSRDHFNFWTSESQGLTGLLQLGGFIDAPNPVPFCGAFLFVIQIPVFLRKVATKMDLVFLPSTGELRMWWVMST